MKKEELIKELEAEKQVAHHKENAARLKGNFVGEAIHSFYADKLRWIIKQLQDLE